MSGEALAIGPERRCGGGGSRRALAVAALALIAVAAGCGGDDAEDALRETADNLADIRSGRLTMKMSVQAGGEGVRGGTVGFSLRGPFSLPEGGGLPRARVTYTQIAGPRRATVTVTTTGRAAFVTVGGQAYRLSAERARRLRSGARRLGKGGAGRDLRIGSWVRDPKLADGGRVGGADTDRISARLDVPAATRDLLRLSRVLGPEGTASLEGAARRQLERAVGRSSFVLHTGKDDRLLRRLAIAVDLAGSGTPEARVRFELALARPNEPVAVKAPPGALPASALPGG